MDRHTTTAVGVFVAASVVAIITSIAVIYGGKVDKEVDAWSWGSYPRLCPPLQLKCSKGLPKSRCTDGWKAVSHLASSLRGVAPNLYVKSPQPGKPVVVLHAPSLLDTSVGGLCSVHAGILGTMGRVERSPAWGSVVQRFEFTVCFNKIHKAKSWQLSVVGPKQDAAIRTVARLGHVGHIAHELLHPYLGDRLGHSHPRSGAGLMASKPVVMSVGPTVREIFKRRIMPRCQRRP